MANNIVVTASGTKDKADLDGCYFLPATAPASGYNFYDADGTLVTTDPASPITGTTFTFKLSGYDFEWTIKDLVISDTAASGKWTNEDPTLAATDPESGDFTAQGSGDPVGEKTASTASA